MRIKVIGRYEFVEIIDVPVEITDRDEMAAYVGQTYVMQAYEKFLDAIPIELIMSEVVPEITN